MGQDLSYLNEKWSADGEKVSQCVFCKHALPGNYCMAFLDEPGIPREILLNQFDHRQPWDGDGGIHFEPRTPEMKSPLAGADTTEDTGEVIE